jgi:aminoglycoside 6'-N-acetyltransferase I
MAITYRRMYPADAPLLVHIVADVFDEKVRPNRLATYLAAPGHLLVLAFDGDLVVGQCAGGGASSPR